MASQLASQFLKTTPVLRMFDIRKAREFYLDFLGFKLDFEHRFEPDLPLYMGISLSSVVLHLSEHHGDCAPGAKVMIETTGLADYQAALLAKRYGYARPGLERQPWGATTLTVTDPFYNCLVFSENGPEMTTA
ncbi:MAG: glyoxalase superfamily protein [Nitrobacter sp.]|jgi:catechol 2,3-dioxygenase-like lactoylglutathione lyase family enzyme